MEEELFNLFDQYHRGELDESQSSNFKARLKSDTSFRKDYDAFKESVILIEGEGIREELKEIMSREPKKGLSLTLVRYASAAAIAGILFLGYSLWSAKEPGEQLFDQYFIPYPDIHLVRAEPDHLMDAALVPYQEGVFKEALQALDAMKPGNVVQFYRGNCLLAMGESRQALFAFRAITDDSVFQDQVIWYTSLAFLRNNQLDSARYYLDKIEPGGFRHRDSQNILLQLQ